MLSKIEIKFIRSLGIGKNRYKQQKFVAEGNKIISELLLSGLACETIFTTDARQFSQRKEVKEISDRELKQISFLVSPKDSLGIFKMPEVSDIEKSEFSSKLGIVCDSIQDPGNMGTIVRIADWFGISNIICSIDSADVFSPKVVQSSMASIARVMVSYRDIVKWVGEGQKDVPIMVSSLHGNEIYGMDLPGNGLIVLGNEARGVSEEIEKLATHRLLIPGSGRAESLNVAVSAGIILAEFRRRFSLQR